MSDRKLALQRIKGTMPSDELMRIGKTYQLVQAFLRDRQYADLVLETLLHRLSYTGHNPALKLHRNGLLQKSALEHIEGYAAWLKELLGLIDISWEYGLAAYFGDIAANPTDLFKLLLTEHFDAEYLRKVEGYKSSRQEKIKRYRQQSEALKKYPFADQTDDPSRPLFVAVIQTCIDTSKKHKAVRSQLAKLNFENAQAARLAARALEKAHGGRSPEDLRSVKWVDGVKYSRSACGEWLIG